MNARVVRGAAWAVLAVAAVDLAGRQIARRALLQALPGSTPAPETVAIIAVGAAAIAILCTRGRSWAGLLLAAAFTTGLALQLQLGARLQSDGFYYFAYLRSLAFDRDVNFMNDYRMLGLGAKTDLFQPTRTGHAESAWTIGPAIVWAPFFAVGHAAAVRLNAQGKDVAADGTSFPYRQAVCVAGLFYGLLGCWFAFRLVRIYFSAQLAAAAIFVAVCGSFMAWYLVKEPSMTHAPSMAAVAAFLWRWAATRERRTLRAWTELGLLAGFMALIRWQNLLFALLPGIDALMSLLAAGRRRDTTAQRTVAIGSALFLIALAIGFLPQMLAWKSIYGSWIARSPLGPQIRWSDPHLVDILWSARNGLFSTTPVLYIAAIGLVIFAAVRPAIGVPALLSVALMIYFNACIQDWWGSAGFGGRRFDGTVPLFALGIAAFIDAAARIVRRHAAASIVFMLTLLVLANAALIGGAQSGAVRIGEPLPFDRAWSAQARVVHHWFGNPFTYPASLWFAMRNGVSPSAYDILSTNRFLADPLQPFGRIDVGGDDEWLLGDGWHAVEQEGSTTFRWAPSSASLRVPLDHAAPLQLQVRVHAFAYPGSPPQRLTLIANGKVESGGACTSLPVPPDWQIVECTLSAASWHGGVNALELRFDHAQRPADVGAGGDARPLAAAVDWIRFSISPDTAR